MAQTAEERKIKRLETEIRNLKNKIEHLEKIDSWRRTQLYNEREWRRNFQSLLKDVIQEDNVEELETW